MSRRRKKRGRGPLWGVTILVLALLGIWGGAQLVDEGPGVEFLPRTLESEAAPGSRTPRVLPERNRRVRVEILNAGGVRGVAALARDQLRDAGFDVVFYGNAPRFSDEPSVVLVRLGALEDAEAVARLLGITEVREALDPSLLLEVTVLLGSDWGLGAGAEMNESEGGMP
jgi:hypothetical protein